MTMSVVQVVIAFIIGILQGVHTEPVKILQLADIKEVPCSGLS